MARAGMGLGDFQVTTNKISRAKNLCQKYSIHIFKVLELHEAFAGQVLSNLKALESEKFCQEKLGLNQKVMKSCCRRRQESVQSIAVPDLRWGRFPWRSSTTGAAPYPLDILSELQVDA